MMRACVIFNPAAKGQKAEKLRARLDVISRHAELKRTAAPGDARRIAAECAASGYTTIIAAGGDGTINEVVNGIGDADAFEKVRLGVLPLGTINVFALELGIPFNVAQAWSLILRGRYTRIDLGFVEFGAAGSGQKRYFIQLAGAGLDARAIELVEWEHKKRHGALAYVIAGWKALKEKHPLLTVTSANKVVDGEMVLIGNGKLYGGKMTAFPNARFRDGHLDAYAIPKARLLSVLRCGLAAFMKQRMPDAYTRTLRSSEFTVTAAEPGAAFELDGELVGRLPAKFGVVQEKLRVIVP